MFHQILSMTFQLVHPQIRSHLHCRTSPASRDGFFISYYVNSDSRTGFSPISSRCTPCVSSTTSSNGLTPANTHSQHWTNTSTQHRRMEPTWRTSTALLWPDQCLHWRGPRPFAWPRWGRSLMDELLEPNLPEPHQHVAAPPPDALPDPSKPSTTASTPPKRKQNAKATPKAPAKRRRRPEQSRSRSSSPLSTWTFEDKQKLRTLKADEKSRFSWRVISTKMGKSEADVRSMWNKIKDRLGWLPAMWKWQKDLPL